MSFGDFCVWINQPLKKFFPSKGKSIKILKFSPYNKYFFHSIIWDDNIIKFSYLLVIGFANRENAR